MTNERPPRPDPLSFDPAPIPDTLTDRSQWVAWRYYFNTDRGEWTKMPLNAESGKPASSTDPDTWSSFETAVAYHEQADSDTDGLGFVVNESDMFVGIDLDDCRDTATGKLAPWADELLDTVPTYAEVSPSGTGLRLFGLGILPDGGNRSDVEGADGHLELYDTGRFLTVTGNQLDSAPDDVCQVKDEVAEIHARYIATENSKTQNPEKETGSHGLTPGVTSGEPGSDRAAIDLSDDQLLDKARNAENGAKFDQLWHGDISGYESHSEADLALTGLLAFWTGGDRNRIDRLMRRSNLYREKWDRESYRKPTIDKALAGRSEYYTPASQNDERNVTLCPEEVASWARLGEDESVSDLNDRAKAACVWDMLEYTDEFHVRVRRDNNSLWSYDDGVWKPEGERTLRHAARQALGSWNYGNNVLSELKAQARSDPRVETEPDEFGVDTGTVAVKNGLLDLDAAAAGAGADALRPLEPADYALTRLPVEYDPTAEFDEWAGLVEEWAEDGRAAALQEYIGYCLHIGEQPIQQALLLVGSGANGKSTFLHVVRALLGEENTTSIELQTLANEANAVADFYGSLANIDDDLSARKLGKGLGMFKKLVGGDQVRARRLYESGFKFEPVGKHLYAANEVPEVDVPDEDEAFWRRWLLVEFPHHYPPSERDPGLRERFTEPEALSGVLNWAIKGRHRLLEQGFFTEELQYPADKRERWQAWGDSVNRFISDCVTRDPEAEHTTTSAAYRRYTAWCREQGEESVSQQQLTTALKNENIGYTQSVRVNGSVQRGYKALGLSDDVPVAREDTDQPATPDEDGVQISIDETTRRN